MLSASIFRITFAPGTANQVRPLDWLQLGEVPVPPWAQAVQVEPGVEALAATVIARANVSRELTVISRVQGVTAVAMMQAAWDLDVSLPAGITGALHVRLLDLSKAVTDTEANRTLKQYVAANATIRSVTHRPVPEEMSIDYTWSIAVGRFTVA